MFETQRENRTCALFLCHQCRNVFTASLLVRAFFWQESHPVSVIQNQVWVRVNFSFTFWCISILMYTVSSVSKKGRITDMHWKCSYKAVKNCIFKTSIKYMLYAVNCNRIFYLISIVIYISKGKLKWESPCLHSEIEKDSLIHELQSWMSSVLLSFTFSFVLLCSEQKQSLVSLPVKVG